MLLLGATKLHWHPIYDWSNWHKILLHTQQKKNLESKKYMHVSHIEMFCGSLNQLCSNTKIFSLITYSLLRIVCSHCTLLGTKITKGMTCGSDSTQMPAYSDILLWMPKLILVWNQGGHIREAEYQEKEYWEEKRVRTISSSKADTSGTRWSTSVAESLAVVFFLSPTGVFKERSKIERVMKISSASSLV